MAGRKGFIDASKQRKDSSSIVHVFSDMQRDRYVYMYYFFLVSFDACSLNLNILANFTYCAPVLLVTYCVLFNYAVKVLILAATLFIILPQ